MTKEEWDVQFKFLTLGQMWTVLWWTLFNKKRYNVFVERMEYGMHAMASFKIANRKS